MIKEIYKDKFIKNNAAFFIGTMIISVLTYLYHPILGRMMNIDAFGEVQALISLIAIFGVILGIYRIIIVNIVSNSVNMQEKQEIITVLKKWGLIFVIIVSLFIIIFSNNFKNFLNFRSPYPFICLAILLLISFISSIRSSILHGLQDFKSVSIMGIIITFSRLVFAVFLVYLGWSAFGAIIALVIAEILGLLYVFYKTRNRLTLFIDTKVKLSKGIKKEFKYGLLVMVVTLCITFFYSADVIIVKHYFISEQAGAYSGIATIARIVFFITGSVTGVLLPSIKINDVDKENRKTLLKAGFLLVGVGGIVLLIFFVAPEFAINLLLGGRYIEYAFLLPKLTFLLFIVSIINLIFFYYLALRKYFLIYIAIISPLIILLLTYFRHDSMSQIINNFLLVNFLVIIYLFFRLLLKNFFKPDLVKV